jgi:hypothetical protein
MTYDVVVESSAGKNIDDASYGDSAFCTASLSVNRPS